MSEEPMEIAEQGPSASMVTVTLNPAIDVSTKVDVVAPDHKMRCGPGVREPGGGGVNVARVANRLGVDVVAVTTSGGSTGAEVVAALEAEGIECRPISIEAPTRESFSVLETETGDNFRFVLPGPSLTPAEIELCLETIVDAAREAQSVVLSGSLPPGMEPQIMRQLADRLSSTRLIVDVSGAALEAAVDSPVFLVKPSVSELASLVNRQLDTEDDVAEAAESVRQRARCHSLVVSMGPGGVMLLAGEEPPVRVRAPTVKVRSAIGAGDSLVAGLSVALARGADLIEATRHGVAAGTATVMSEGTGLCNREDVARLLKMVRVDG